MPERAVQRAAHVVGHLAHPLPGEVTTLQQFGSAHDGGHRRPQLMRQDLDEGVPDLEGLALGLEQAIAIVDGQAQAFFTLRDAAATFFRPPLSGPQPIGQDARDDAGEREQDEPRQLQGA